MEDKMDKGVKKAFTSQTRPRLASNFTYRTMERIRLETARKEARRERRSFVWMLVCAFVMLGCCLGIMIEACGIRMDDVTKTFHSTLTILSEGGYCLPTILCLPLLGVFNYWLRKKFRRLLE